MPRQTLSEFRAKNIVYQTLGKTYVGWEIDAEGAIEPQLKTIDQEGPFVVKVDQAVKGRFKKGLVHLNIPKIQLAHTITELHSKGYRWILIEPFLEHKTDEEHYISFIKQRDGLQIYYSSQGGIDVEAHDKLQSITPDATHGAKELAKASRLSLETSEKLFDLFSRDHFVFMEMNPFLLDQNGSIQPLDVAVEVDDAASYFVDEWHETDLRVAHTEQTKEEDIVKQLAHKSPASFTFQVLNPDGAVFVLLSGGGASVTIADEIYAQGFGKELGNYGEYSGAPNTEETYIYTSALLATLLKSKAPKKVLLIGGAVANFTDILKTFKGVIQAIDDVAPKLQQQSVKIFVRRGGPREEEGLAAIQTALKKHGLLGAVYDASVPFSQVVKEAMKELT